MKKSDKALFYIETIGGLVLLVTAFLVDSWVAGICSVIMFMSGFHIFYTARMNEMNDMIRKQIEIYTDFLDKFREECNKIKQ